MTPAESLWQAVVAAYGKPGVAPLCLRLQETGDIDVMLLLSLCYAARGLGAPLAPAEVRALRALSEPWRARAVRPARRLRIDLRAPIEGVADTAREGFRDRLKAIELEAERMQAGIAADWLTTRKSGAPDPLPGLHAYLCGTPITEAEIALLLDAFDTGTAV